MRHRYISLENAKTFNGQLRLLNNEACVHVTDSFRQSCAEAEILYALRNIHMSSARVAKRDGVNLAHRHCGTRHELLRNLIRSTLVQFNHNIREAVAENIDSIAARR